MSVAGAPMGCGVVVGRAGNSSPMESWEAHLYQIDSCSHREDAGVYLGFARRNESVEALGRV